MAIAIAKATRDLQDLSKEETFLVFVGDEGITMKNTSNEVA